MDDGHSRWKRHAKPERTKSNDRPIDDLKVIGHQLQGVERRISERIAVHILTKGHSGPRRHRLNVGDDLPRVKAQRKPSSVCGVNLGRLRKPIGKMRSLRGPLRTLFLRAGFWFGGCVSLASPTSATLTLSGEAE